MSAKPWSQVDEPPFGFRVTIERRNRQGKKEFHSFPSKTTQRAIAQKAAHYKYGFLRLVEAVPMNRQEWDRAFGKAAA